MQEVFDLNKLDALMNPDGLLSRLETNDRFKLYSTSLNYLVTYYLDIRDSTFKSEDLIVRSGIVPSDISMWPLDKDRQAMDLILDIKMSKMDDGPVRLFMSKNVDSFSSKDRSWFCIFPFCDSEKQSDRLVPVNDLELKVSGEIVLNAIPFIDVGKFDEVLNLADRKETSLDLFNELKEIFESFNQSVLSACWATEDYFQRARLARQKAAFYANGISYSEARASDPHFNHLIEESKKWLCLSGELNAARFSGILDL